MTTPKMDPSLAEVREWRAKLQEELAPLDPKEELEYLHRKSRALIQKYGLRVAVTGAEEKVAAG